MLAFLLNNLLKADENHHVLTLNDGYIAYVYDKPGMYTFKVPFWGSELYIKLWGSAGDDLKYSGAGGYSEGTIEVNASDVFGIEVGSPSIKMLNLWRPFYQAGSRSAIWKDHELNEIIVAGGGGGSGGDVGPFYGGAGGGLIGQSSMMSTSIKPFVCESYANPAEGGSQTKGGDGGSASPYMNHYPGVSGGRNYGSRGNGKLNYHEGGPGGGGYYGGGSGGASCWSTSGGGGGSGFISPLVINGKTETGNYTTPANNQDPLRGNAGSPGYPGLVIIRIKKPQIYTYANRFVPMFAELIFIIFE